MTHGDTDGLQLTQYDEDYFVRLQHCGRYTRVDSRTYFLGTLRRWLAGKAKLIDVGCGDGFYTLHLAKGKQQSVGMDISMAALKRANRDLGCTIFTLGAAEALPFHDCSFDAMLALDVVEHLQRPDRFLEEACRVLAPKGRLVISTPNPASIGARTCGSDWFAWRDSSHIGIHPWTEWRSALRQAGFIILRDGTDGPWDFPYRVPVPALLQRLALVPLIMLTRRFIGTLPWALGENYVALVERPVVERSGPARIAQLIDNGLVSI